VTAERFDKVASGATMAAQLRDLTLDVQVECSIRELPTSSAWAALKCGECGSAEFEHMLVSSRLDGDLVETTLLRFRIPDAHLFRPELVKRLSEALPRTLVH
jgi:hypothetical protein